MNITGGIMEPPKYLVIDRTKALPIRAVVSAGGQMAGNTRLLLLSELPAYSTWLGQVGGRELLDAFELQLINDGVLTVRPVDANGHPLRGEFEAVEFRRQDDGPPRLVWETTLKCTECDGEGHHAEPGESVDESDLCMNCCGEGKFTGAEFETGMDGEPVQPHREA